MRTAFCVVAAAAASLGVEAASATPARQGDLYDFGKCIVKADREAAVELLQTIPLQPSEVTIVSSQLGDGAACSEGERLVASSTLVRGAIAQGLLLKDFPRFGVEPKIALHKFARLDLPVGEASMNVDQRTADLYKLADCVVRNQALKTESLFRSAPGSEHEARVLDAMAPYIAACHGSVSELRVGRPEFRSMIAQAAYSVSARYWSGELWSAK